MVGRDRVRRQLCPKTWEGRGGWAGSAAALRARWPCQHRTGLSCASQGPGARRALCTAALPGCRAQRIARQCGGHEGGPGQHRTGFSCASQGKAAWRVRVVVRWAGSACGRRRRPRGVWRRQCCGWPFGGGNRTMALWFGFSTTEWMDCQNFPPGNKPMPSRHQTFLARNNLRNGLFLGQTSTFSENIAR